jgi:hypothetical protein
MKSCSFRSAALGIAMVVVGMLASATPAAADSVTNISSFTDPRGAMANTGGQLVRGLYGPFTVPANSEVHNAIDLNAPAPCQNCYITDMVPDLVDASSGNTVNLAQDIMLHHFVLINQAKADLVCPGGLQGGLGQRFFAAGNERTEMHLPSPYGYRNDATPTWRLIYHLVNKSTTQSKTVNIQVVYRYRTTGVAALPLWLDIDGCGDSEYTAPVGYSDTHSTWTSNLDGRFIGLAGHLHDVDITTLSKCLNNTDDDADGKVNDGCPAVNTAESGSQCDNNTDNDGDGRINDGCPVVGTAEGIEACPDHCPEKGHGIAVSTEIVGGPSGHYYGPIPPNRAPPGDLTGATVCRSEGYYGTTWAANQGDPWRGHLDTMSSCGIFNELPAGHQAEAYPAGGGFPIDGYPLKSGQVVKLHSEYQNDTGLPQTDVMGIVMAWLAPTTPGYARPSSATPMTIRFVPAFNSCGSGNTTHAAPLASPSCNPPVQKSNYLTVGTPDIPGNGFPANSTGYAIFKVVGESPINPNNGDQADVQVNGQITDVRRKANPAQTYTGQIQLNTTVRITDKYNVMDQATASDVPFNVTTNCSSGTCSFATSFDAAMPGVMKEGKRAVWELGQVKIFDGGSDDNVSTAGNTLFEVQGYYAP